ncbi:MAG: ChaN family lipoprotein [Coleofasciculus sp. C3-bin4]|nr:ChaN family lipoprotein [Coleofasciculus sp. C3-bin4]
MRKRQIAKVCAWSLGIFFLCTTPTYAESPSTPLQQEQQQLTQQQILQELVKANVVYLGETHNSPEDHKAQLEILQALHQQNPKIAIAMEMFQRPFQDVLDQYLAGKITEAQFVEQSEYDKRWGFPWEYYAPILRLAKINQLPVLALNTPTELTRKVARSGLESLTTDERRYIPPFSEIRTDNADYRKMAQEVYEQHHQAGHGNSTSFERFFTAQVLWDETMAETIAQFVKANPGYQVVVLAGKSHIVYGYGIPSRVARRLNNNQFVQRSVLLGVSQEAQSSGEKAIADYFWQHQETLNLLDNPLEKKQP